MSDSHEAGLQPTADEWQQCSCCETCRPYVRHALTLAIVRDRYETMKINGYEVYAHPCDALEIRDFIDSKNAWNTAFHKACHKIATEYGEAGDPLWDDLIRLTDHPKGRKA